LRLSASFRVEVDALPGGFVCSATMKGMTDSEEVRSAARGERPLRKLFSKEQREFYAAHAPEGVGLNDPTVLAPSFLPNVRRGPRLGAEMWLYPDGSRVPELWTRCTPGEAFQVAAETRAFLARHGVDLSGEQETKTHKALDYFASALREAE